MDFGQCWHKLIILQNKNVELLIATMEFLFSVNIYYCINFIWPSLGLTRQKYQYFDNGLLTQKSQTLISLKCIDIPVNYTELEVEAVETDESAV